jgi:hypothetical protein
MVVPHSTLCDGATSFGPWNLAHEPSAARLGAEYSLHASDADVERTTEADDEQRSAKAGRRYRNARRGTLTRGVWSRP